MISYFINLLTFSNLIFQVGLDTHCIIVFEGLVIQTYWYDQSLRIVVLTRPKIIAKVQLVIKQLTLQQTLDIYTFLDDKCEISLKNVRVYLLILILDNKFNQQGDSLNLIII